MLVGFMNGALNGDAIDGGDREPVSVDTILGTDVTGEESGTGKLTEEGRGVFRGAIFGASEPSLVDVGSLLTGDILGKGTEFGKGSSIVFDLEGGPLGASDLSKSREGARVVLSIGTEILDSRVDGTIDAIGVSSTDFPGLSVEGLTPSQPSLPIGDADGANKSLAFDCDGAKSNKLGPTSKGILLQNF